VTDALLSERDAAVRAVDARCPHCGAERSAEQRYCVECGHALPQVSGKLAGWRRRWIRRVGWYPGDWVWPALALLLFAAAGAAAAIAVAHHRHAGTPQVITALGGVAVAQPTTPVQTTAAAGTLPTPPEPTTAKPGAKRTLTTWATGQTGWTIVLVSYPKTTGRPAAKRTALQALKAGLPDVGLLDSSRFPSLQPGYFVIFSGIYASQAEANSAVPSAHQAGFGAAYSRQING
jgi:zinc-ribbon domain